MKLHPRTQIVSRAELDLGEWFSTYAKKHGLTWNEELQVATRFSHDMIARALKYEIRAERHGDMESEGDLLDDCPKCKELTKEKP